MNTDTINILRRNGHIVWTRESGLPYPTDWALADARPSASRFHDDVPMRIGQPIKRDEQAFAIKAAVLVASVGTGSKKDQAIAIYHRVARARRSSHGS